MSAADLSGEGVDRRGLVREGSVTLILREKDPPGNPPHFLIGRKVHWRTKIIFGIALGKIFPSARCLMIV